MMGRTVYAHPQDLVQGNATITLSSGAVETGYPVTRLIDGAPGLSVRFSSQGFRVVLEFSVAQKLDGAALIHPYGDAALAAIVEGNTSDSWPGPLQGALTLSAPAEDGFLPNPWIDLRTVDADAGDRTFAFWSVLFPDGTAVPRLGEIVLIETLRVLPDGDDLAWGHRTPDRFPMVRHETAAGISLSYAQGTRLASLVGEARVHDDGLAALRSWRRASRARSSFLAVDDDVAACVLAEWVTDTMDPTHIEAGAHTVPVDLAVVSAGLPWVDPDEA